MKNQSTKWTLIIILFLLTNHNLIGQTYYPSAVKSALFNETEKLMVEVGINNYSTDYSIHYQFKRFVLSLQRDYNNGSLYINPLNFHSISG